MKILVTGAAGFIGSHLVDKLVALGHNVYGVDDLSGGSLHNVSKKCFFTKLDLQRKSLTANYIAKVQPKFIFHLAADASEGRSQFTPLSSTQRNYLAYLHVLIPAIKHGVKKVILISSMSVYGSQKPPFDETMERRPNDIYGVSKAAMEQATEILSETYGFTYTIIRPHNVYGPRQNMSDPYRNVIAIFINCLLNSKNFYIYGDGQQKRAFSYIDDVVFYIIKAAFSKTADKEIFNIGPTKEFTINHLAELVLKNFFPNRSIPTTIKPAYLSPRPFETKNAWCTVSKAEKILGYETTISLSDGIKKMIAWARIQGPQKFRYLNRLELKSQIVPLTWENHLL